MAVEADLLADRYELLRPVGQGGMAQVFEGHDRVLDRRVAIKVLHSRFGQDAEFLARFKREARAAASLAHPGIVGVYDTGESEGTHFIVMEYVEGHTLAEVLATEVVMPPDRASETAIEVCAALSAAHAKGLVHRDVKPGNIMVTPGGQIKVMDFGIARAVESSTLLTSTSGIIGTPRYMSPEQVEGRPLDARSDLYSLGVVLYESLTGRVPFDGTSAIAVAAQHVNDPPVPPRQLRPEVPASVETVTLKALAKDPVARYQSAADLADGLRQAREDRGAVVLPPVQGGGDGAFRDAGRAVGAPPAVVQQPERRAAGRDVARGGGRRPGRVLGVLALLLFVGLAGFVLGPRLAGDRDGATAPTATATAADQVTVPDVATGISLAEARQVLESAGLTVQEEAEPSDEVAEDLVTRVEPGPGATLARGADVILWYSSGPSGAGSSGDSGQESEPAAAPAPAEPSAQPSGGEDEAPAPEATAGPSTPETTQPEPSAPSTPEPTPTDDPETEGDDRNSGRGAGDQRSEG